MRRHQRSMLAATVVGVSAAVLAGAAARAGDLSDVLGVTHIDGSYSFTNEPYLEEGADQVLGTGSKVIKLEMGQSTTAKYPWDSSWPSYSSLKGLAQTPYFQNVFSKPLDTYVITAYSMSIPGASNVDEYWLNGMTAAQKAAEQQQFYDLTKYLMQTYAGTGKTFVMEQWEGDWALRDPGRNTQPSATAVQGMIDWINARQAGILQARAELAGTSDVKVLGALEVNRVSDAMNPSFTWATVTNNVLPYTTVDLASYSSYDTEYNTTGANSFTNAVNYIATKLPSTAIYGQSTRSVGIGEFGVPEDTKASSVATVMSNVVGAVKALDLPYAVYWEIYSNEPKSGVTPPVTSDADVNGYWMVKPDGTPGLAWHQFRYQLTTNDSSRATTAAVQRDGLHLAYASNFNVPGATLGAAWSANTSGGAMSVGLANGQVQMTTVNAGTTPVGQLTLNVASVLGRGLNPGEYLQFTLNRQNAAGIIGVSAFGTNAGSGIGAGSQALNAWQTPLNSPPNPAAGWTPISFTPSGATSTYNWDTSDTLGLRLDSADGNFATVSYYLNGAYSGSWLFKTSATSLNSFSFFAQSATAGAGFGFNNLAIYTTSGDAAGTTFRWDPTHTNSPGGGGSGTWDAASNAHFYNGASDVTWNYATLADAAAFGGTAGTVTVSGNVMASGLTFNSSGYTLTGGTLTMMGNQTILAGAGTATTINTPLAGNSGVTVKGPGVVTLGGTNPFTGGLYVSGGGTVRFAADGNLGAAGQPVTLDGGTVSYIGNVNSSITETRAFNVGAGGGTFDVPNPASAPAYGKVVINGTNLVTGPGPITKSGPGWLTIYGSGNDATGNWAINGGVVEVGAAGGLGTGTVTVNSGGELAANTTTPLPNAVTLNAGGTIGTDFGSASGGTFAGSVTVNGNANVRLGNFWNSTSQNVTLTGNLAGHGALTVLPASGATSSTGRLTLTGDNAAFSGGFVVPIGTVAAGLSTTNTLGTGPITLCGGKLALQGRVAAVGMPGGVAPVAVTGFNRDTIYAASETGKYPSGDGTTNTLMDGSFSFYQTGFTPPAGSLNAGTPLTGGLPGSTFTSVPTGIPFALQPLAASNTLQINQGAAGTLTLATPTAFTRLALLATSSWGADETPALTLSFSDGTNVTTTYKAYDWSIGTDAARQAASAFGASGVDRYGPTQAPGWDQRPFAAYETDVDLTNIGGVDYSGRLVTALTFAATTFDAQGRGKTDVFAVSGAARAWGTSPSQAYSNPVTVTADSTIDVIGSLAATLGPLTIGTSKLSVTSTDATTSPYSLTFGSTTLTGGATYDVASSSGGGAGTLVLGAVAGTGSVTKSGPGTLRLTAGGVVSGGITINGGAVSIGGNAALGAIAIAAGATLDTASYRVALDYADASPADVVRSYLLTGRNGGAWNGTGITSSAAQADPTHDSAIGYVEASQLLGLAGSQTSTWAGLAVDATTLLLRYTYYGDLNLDGRVNADDYALLDRGLAKHLSGWVNGDVNYDGTVDAADYLLIDRAFALGGNQLSADFLAAREAQFGRDYVTTLVASVPEPSVVGVIVPALLLSMRRRRS